MRKVLIWFIAAALLFVFPFGVSAQKRKKHHKQKTAKRLKTKPVTQATKIATSVQIAEWVRKTGNVMVGHRDILDKDTAVTSRYIIFYVDGYSYLIGTVIKPEANGDLRIVRWSRDDGKDAIELVDSDGDNSVDMCFCGKEAPNCNVEELWQEYLAAVSARMPAEFKTAPP